MKFSQFVNPITLFVGPALVSYLVYKSTKSIEDGGYHLPAWRIIVSYIVWLIATRTMKLLPHLWFRPQDIIYVPAYIIFGYYFAAMKIYALLTLHETGWGTRVGVGVPEEANAASNQQQQQQKTPVMGGKDGPFADQQNNNWNYNNNDGRSANARYATTPLRQSFASGGQQTEKRLPSHGGYSTPDHVLSGSPRRRESNFEMQALPR